jgi:hypothetical protein
MSVTDGLALRLRDSKPRVMFLARSVLAACSDGAISVSVGHRQ